MFDGHCRERSAPLRRRRRISQVGSEFPRSRRSIDRPTPVVPGGAVGGPLPPLASSEITGRVGSARGFAAPRALFSRCNLAPSPGNPSDDPDFPSLPIRSLFGSIARATQLARVYSQCPRLAARIVEYFIPDTRFPTWLILLGGSSGSRGSGRAIFRDSEISRLKLEIVKPWTRVDDRQKRRRGSLGVMV